LNAILKKQSQFISVLCSAFSGQRQDEEKEFEKTNPICRRQNERNFSIHKGSWGQSRFRSPEKQSQTKPIAGLRAET
jgi:hypothetical protein